MRSVLFADASSGTAHASSKATDKSVKNIAQTFAPRASGNTGSNPATKGSVLYDIFTYQAWILMVVGGLLSFNLIFPSDKPDIARLMGCAMISKWLVKTCDGALVLSECLLTFLDHNKLFYLGSCP